MQELQLALNTLKVGKAEGIDGVFPEFLKSCGATARTWLLSFYNDILKKKLKKYLHC